MVMVVYISPNANTNLAMDVLHNVISSQQIFNPDAVHIIGGELNHADLRSILSRFHKHIKSATRSVNSLDKADSNIQKGYRETPLLHLGLSDHIAMLLISV